MTRFWLTLQQGVDFVIDALERIEGGEVFVPRIPSMRIVDLATRSRPAARRHRHPPRREAPRGPDLEDEARHALEFPQHYSVYPAFPFWRETPYPAGQRLEPGFHYSSDSNTEWLTLQDFRELVPADSAASVSGR